MTQPPPQPPSRVPQGFGPPPAAFGPAIPPIPSTPPPSASPPAVRRVRQWPAFAAILVGLALVLGSGAVYLTSGSGGSKPAAGAGAGGKGTGGGSAKQAAPPSAKLLFHQLAPKASGDSDRVRGEWLTDKVYAKTGFKDITGYDSASGAQLWKLPLPTQVCITTPQSTADGITLIAYDDGTKPTFEGTGPCTSVAAFNITTGKMLWHTLTPVIGISADGTGDANLPVEEIAISGHTAAVGSGPDGGAAWDLATGRLLWKPTANADNCQDDGYAGGPALVAVRRCGDYAKPSLSVQTLDPTTGQPLSTYKVSSAFTYMHVLSTKPLVVGGYPGGDSSDAKVSDIYSVDGATGKELAHITIPDEKYSIDCIRGAVSTCLGPLAGGGKLFLPTAAHANVSSDVPGQTNEFLAFDLATGKPVPGRADAGDGGQLVPIRMDGDNVIALRSPPIYGHGEVVSIDGATLKQTVLMELPNDDKILNGVLGLFSISLNDVLYDKGRLYIGEHLLDKGAGTITEPQYLFAVLGVG